MSPPRSKAQILWFWVLLVVLYFLWEAASYRGFFALAAEWQLAHFSQYLPTLTFGSLVLLFGSPALLLFRRDRRRAERDDAAAIAAQSEAEQEAASIRVATGFMRFLFGLAGALLLAALGSLCWTLTLPGADGPVRTVTLGTPTDRAPQEGPTRLLGAIVYKRTASFSQGLPLMRRGVRYAPVVVPNGGPAPLRYFVELGPQDRLDPRPGDGGAIPSTGILVRGSLPGAIVKLYRYAGYRVEWPYFVLYASTTTMRWPYFVAATEFALGALAFLIVALFQRRHIRRLRETAIDSEEFGG